MQQLYQNKSQRQRVVISGEVFSLRNIFTGRLANYILVIFDTNVRQATSIFETDQLTFFDKQLCVS